MTRQGEKAKEEESEPEALAAGTGPTQKARLRDPRPTKPTGPASALGRRPPGIEGAVCRRWRVRPLWTIPPVLGIAKLRATGPNGRLAQPAFPRPACNRKLAQKGARWVGIFAIQHTVEDEGRIKKEVGAEDGGEGAMQG